MKKGEGIQFCTIEGCGKRHDARGYCRMHYTRLQKHGSTADPRPTTHDRFWSKVQRGEGCWEWTAGKNANGYGRIQMGTLGETNVQLAHRVAYGYVKGPIPEGKALDHICRNPGCVKPDHLRPVTAKENLENLSGAFSTSKSGIRGVCWEPRRNSWRATVTHNKRQYHVGFFSTIGEAEAAVVARRNELFTHNDVDRRAA
jgi:hypothetical protein